jgi:hypothetical protein
MLCDRQYNILVERVPATDMTRRNTLNNPQPFCVLLEKLQSFLVRGI